MPVVVLGRMVQGFGAGAISSVAYVAVARGYDESEKPRMLALLSSAWVLPGLIGPAVAAQLAEHAGWRVVFIGLAPLAVLSSAIAAPGLSRLVAPDPAPSPSKLRDIVSAGAAEADVRVGRAALVCMGLLAWCFFGAEAFVPLTLTSIRGVTLTVSGFALTAGTLTWTAGAWIQERLARRGRHRALVRAGFATLGAGVALFAALLRPETPDAVGVVAWAIAGIGMGVAYSTLSLVVLALPAPGREGAAATALQLANVLGIAAGTGVGGALVAVALATDHTQGLGVFATFATAVLAAVLGYVFAGGLRNQAAEDPATPRRTRT
jgi:MFS family permease